MNQTSAEPLLEEGTLIKGKWEILSHIATGGKGEVYLARQINLDRQVALKVMSKQFMEDLSDNLEELESELERFRREVKVMASMRHPNVLPVYDFDQLDVDGETLDFIAMEYVPGPTLKLTMPKEGFGWDECAVRSWLQKYFLPVLDGVEAIHDKGIVHRDLKPANVLIDEGVPKIADFGLAGGQHFDNVTRSHHIIGTMPYMPEEQFLDLALTDVRADVYALGKILFEAVDGKLSPEKTKPFQTVSLSDPPTPFFTGLDRIIRQATAKDRSDRTPDVPEMRSQITTLLDKGAMPRTPLFSTTARSWLKKTAVPAGIVLIGLVVYLLWTSRLQPPEQTADQLLPVPQSTAEDGTAAPLLTREVAEGQPVTDPPLTGSGQPPEAVVGLDGVTLHLVPAGSVDMAADDPSVPKQAASPAPVAVAPFYMDETQVTNHLYVDFLHQVPGLEIKNKAVIFGDEVWLLLGEVIEGYEPVYVRNGKPAVKPEAASLPVVRVTPFGALAYARFYGRTLPSMAQWRHAVQAGNGPSPSAAQPTRAIDAPDTFSSMMDGMMGETTAPSAPRTSSNGTFKELLPVYDLKPNRLGIRGLQANVNEWTYTASPQGLPEFHIHGVLGELGASGTYLERQPWEAFSRVGFRTVLTLREDGG